MTRDLSQFQTPGYTQETWLTPLHVLVALGAFDLDPCAAPSPRPWATAKRHIELPENGLAADWCGRRVWLNPPYGKEAARWLAKLADHRNGIALIFARTDTGAFHAHVWEQADAVLFLAGRISFCDRTGKPARTNGGAPSCLVAYGAENVAALESCCLSGHLVRIARAKRETPMRMFA